MQTIRLESPGPGRVWYDRIEDVPDHVRRAFDLVLEGRVEEFEIRCSASQPFPGGRPHVDHRRLILRCSPPVREEFASGVTRDLPARQHIDICTYWHTVGAIRLRTGLGLVTWTAGPTDSPGTRGTWYVDNKTYASTGELLRDLAEADRDQDETDLAAWDAACANSSGSHPDSRHRRGATVDMILSSVNSSGRPFHVWQDRALRSVLRSTRRLVRRGDVLAHLLDDVPWDSAITDDDFARILAKTDGLRAEAFAPPGGPEHGLVMACFAMTRRRAGRHRHMQVDNVHSHMAETSMLLGLLRLVDAGGVADRGLLGHHTDFERLGRWVAMP